MIDMLPRHGLNCTGRQPCANFGASQRSVEAQFRTKPRGFAERLRPSEDYYDTVETWNRLSLVIPFDLCYFTTHLNLCMCLSCAIGTHSMERLSPDCSFFVSLKTE